MHVEDVLLGCCLHVANFYTHSSTRSWKLRPTAARKAAAQVLLCRDEGPLCHGGEICSAVLEKLEWDGGHFPTTPSLSVISTRLLCCTHEDNAVFCYKRGR